MTEGNKTAFNFTRRNFLKILGLSPLFLIKIDRIFNVYNSIFIIDNDEKFCNEKFKYFISVNISSNPIGDIIGFVGKSFLGTEYVANTYQ